MTMEIMEPEKKSTHRVEIVPIVLEKHPTADNLSIVNVFGGYTCVVNTEQWQGLELGAYIPPDSSVDVKREEFAFLHKDAKSNGLARIKAKKLRGIVSFGLMVPAPIDSKEGDDVADLLGVTHYEPAIAGDNSPQGLRLYMGGDVAPSPDVFTVKYDIDALRRYHEVFEPGEGVVISEKVDGSSCKYVFADGQMHCSSRNEWKKEYPAFEHVNIESLTKQGLSEERAKEIIDNLQSKPKRRNLWWEILDMTPTLEKFCRDNPEYVVYGEAFGNIGRIKYGIPDRFAAFDVMHQGRWLDAAEGRDLMTDYDVPVVPLIANIPYNFETICAFADGETLVDGAQKGTIREGCVIKTFLERHDRRIGRVQLKCVSAEYLTRY